MIRLLSVVILLAALSNSAQGNVLKELSLDQKVESSELVIIGTVVGVKEQGCLEMYRCAYLKVVSVLKGSPDAEIPVLFDGPIAEEESACCEAGRSYLFFLTKVRGAYYASSNGPYGVYRTP